MVKQYSKLLSYHVKCSGLTLRQIAQMCSERGHPIDPSYISKLQTNRLPPPSEEVSQTLAEVLGANVEEFVYWGYVEKAPEVIRQRLLSAETFPPEIISYATKIAKLSTIFKQKIMNEIKWLEQLEELR